MTIATDLHIPIDLQQRLRTRKVIPFIGAGVSRTVRHKDTRAFLFPTWKELLERAIDDINADKKRPGLVREFLSRGDYLSAAQYAKEELGITWLPFLNKHINPSFEDVDESSLALARAVWRLPSSLIITTNYDKVLRWACPQQNDLDTWDIQATAEQAQFVRDGKTGKPTIWHLHGRIDNAADIILTIDGYKRLYPDRKDADGETPALQTLRQSLSAYTFLFIGFSMDDAAVGDQLRWVSEVFKGYTGQHYVVAPEKEQSRISSIGLPVEVIGVADYGQPLLDYLHQLAEIADTPDTSTPVPPPAPAALPPATPVSKADADAPPFNVPFRAKGKQVIGRELQLRAVHEQLLNGRPTAIGQTASFQGIGGLGKTQLAVEYAYEFRHEYPNGVIWINADQDINAQLTELAVSAWKVDPLTEHKDKLAIALHRLRSISDCLIIFDNVENHEAIAPYLPLPSASPHLIVTSRTEQAGFTPIELDKLDPSQSLALLVQESGREMPVGDERLAADGIAAELDGLPLALELAGAYLRYRSAVTWAQYLDLLRRNMEVALPARFYEGFTRHDADLYRTLHVDDSILDETPRLRDILDLLTWSGSASIGLSLLCALLGVDDQLELIDALARGVTLRLLQKMKDDERYSLHRLVQEVRQHDIPLGDRAEWVDSIAQRVGDWFQIRRDEYLQLSDYEAEIDHLTAWQSHAHAFARKHYCRLIWLHAYPPFHRGQYRESHYLVQQALDEYKLAERHTDDLYAHLLNDVGSLYNRLGDYQAGLTHCQQGLVIRRKLFGEQHRDTASSLNEVGVIYSALGKYQMALTFYEQALDIRRKLFGGRHRDTAASLNSVGEAFDYLRQYQTALTYYEQALEIHRELFGEQHPAVAQSLNNFGAAFIALGQSQTALTYLEQALDIRRRVFGEQHPMTATSLNNIGAAYKDMGEYNSATEHFRRALTIYRELLGDLHPDTVNAINNLASTLAVNQELKEALHLLEVCLKTLPLDHIYYGKISDHRRRLLQKPIQKGFRQPAANSATKKAPHKKRKSR